MFILSDILKRAFDLFEATRDCHTTVLWSVGGGREVFPRLQNEHMTVRSCRVCDGDRLGSGARNVQLQTFNRCHDLLRASSSIDWCVLCPLVNAVN
jgi:hypothetical protein